MRSRLLIGILLFLCLATISFMCACKGKEAEVNSEIIVLIELPADSYYQQGERIRFVGSGADMEGEVSDSRLEWTSSIDGVIGTGSRFARNDLSAGEHEIVLTAINEAGQVFTDTTTIEIFKRRAPKKSARKKERWFRRITDPVDGGLYVEVHDGTVVDMTTGLMWEKSPDNALRSFRGAIDYAKKLRLGGYKNWRVPTVHELRSISNISFTDKYRRMLKVSGTAVVHSAAICNVFDTMNGHFWAVDAAKPYVVIANKRYGHSINYRYSSTANYFRGTYTPYSFNNPGYVRCVRYCDMKKWRRLLTQKK